jgi:ABC-type multidrug transport system fused ATPase/permease subunit
VLQESILFSGTIAENLRLAKPNATDAELIEALQAASAWEFVRQLDDGLQALVGERGARLSGGQKQRLSIARVFLKNPPILLLDEATSALDSLSEKLVQEAMDRLMAGRTTLVVAHRISTVKNADDILVMRAGRIETHGRHATLLESSPLYRELCSHQGLS